MILKILMMFMVLTPMTLTLQAGIYDRVVSFFQKPAESAPPKIKVLIVHDKPGVVVEVKGKYKIFDPHTGEYRDTRFVGKRKLIQALQDGIKWGEEFPGIHQLMIVPDEITSAILVDGIEYHGNIYVYDVEGLISIVNEVNIENYLSSVLTSYSRDKYEEETFNAIAIAARTTTYYFKAHPRNQFWDVDGQQVGYQGSAVINPRTSIARGIQATRYMIMNKSKDDTIVPFVAQWTKDSANSSEVESQITLTEANDLAKRGDHAAQILAKAFPGIKIELMHYSETPAK